MLLPRVANRTQWDSLAPKLERLLREFRVALIRVRVFRSMVVAPRVDDATRSIRLYLRSGPEARTNAVVFASMILLSVVAGILIASL